MVRTRFFRLHEEITRPAFADWACAEVRRLGEPSAELCTDLLRLIWRRWNFHERADSFQFLSSNVGRSLRAWRSDAWPLKIADGFVNPLEMLQLQARGERVVGFFFTNREHYFEPAPEHVALTLLLHDLEHAFHFFADQKSYVSQQNFFRWLLENYSDLESYFAPTPESISRLHYLVSDMNGNIIYLLKTLRGIIDLEPQAQAFWNHLTSTLPPPITIATKTINRNESPEATALIQSFFEIER